MGLFSKLFGSSSPKTVQVTPKETPKNISKEPDSTLPKKDVAYFREILQTEFPAYTIKESVAVTELVGDANDKFQLYATRPNQAYKAEWGKPYTFVLYQYGEAKGVVMLGENYCSDYRRVKYLISKMYAKKINIPYICFYIYNNLSTPLPNERDYVIKRISKSLNGTDGSEDCSAPAKVTLTMQEIADKFNIPAEQIEIKK